MNYFQPNTKWVRGTLERCSDGFCSFPHRHCDGTTEASDSRRDMLEHQNEHFVRDFLKFHTLQLQNRRFPTSLLTDRPQNRRFVQGLRRFFMTCHHTPRLPRNWHHGCERLRTVAATNATSSEHSSTPTSPEWKREPLLRIREQVAHIIFFSEPSPFPPQVFSLREQAEKSQSQDVAGADSWSQKKKTVEQAEGCQGAVQCKAKNLLKWKLQP